MFNQIRRIFNEIVHDQYFTIPALLFVLIFILKIILGSNESIESSKTGSFPWNTQALVDADVLPEPVKVIDKDDIDYGQLVRGICLQDDKVLFIFDDDLDRKVQLLVYDVFGEYLYGYSMYIGGRSTMRIALSPCYEGILLFDYKEREDDRYPVTLLTPNGYSMKKWFANKKEFGLASEAYIDCSSDYEVINEDGKYVIRRKDDVYVTTIFDYAEP